MSEKMWVRTAWVLAVSSLMAFAGVVFHGMTVLTSGGFSAHVELALIAACFAIVFEPFVLVAVTRLLYPSQVSRA